MRILVLGGGGREHALAWKISTSPQASKVYLSPGNAGTQALGFETLALAEESPASILKKVQELEIGLVVIGPEAYLNAGYADFLREAGVKVVGPGKKGAALEASKAFSKEFMERHHIPTAEFTVVDSESELLSHSFTQWPTVLKLDGLAAGKGVVLPNNLEEVKDFANRIWHQNEFGKGPHRVVIERFIAGTELSYIGMCDGDEFVALATATDYKRLREKNTGPNTGGMGSISPSPYFSPELEKKIRHQIIEKILKGLREEAIDYRGALYVGLMITAEGEPYVLEFNARFGDPETQAILLRLESDFVELLEHTATQSLKQCPTAQWTKEHSVYIVGAADGYPAKPRTGDEISGAIPWDHPSQVFFAGVGQKAGKLVTSGGRVLGVGALGKNFEEAKRLAYQGLEKIDWNGKYHRTDIGVW